MVDTIYVEEEIIGTKKLKKLYQNLDMQKLLLLKGLGKYLIHLTKTSEFRK